jgi:hypothetical protein
VPRDTVFSLMVSNVSLDARVYHRYGQAKISF